MSTIQVRRDIPALPDLVFATAAEPARLAEWLPEPLTLVGLNDDVLILRWHDEPHQIRVTADLDRLRLDWHALADERCRGSLEVALVGAAGSVAILEMTGPDDLAATLLEALAKEVERTFAPG
ncbi:hypothetical protein [Actinosynnema sp. NPDC020468]|uniref:hypothetical protein n=1 Tax=Actinosynnema sp. NPDC020468 TaxID=3154488 RepID=UPI0033F530CA